MINKEFFFKGFKSILAPDSPALALGCCFIAIGALLKNLGFNIQESIFSTMLTYALPGSLVMAESLLVGASLLNIFLAVWFVNARLYPMAVSLFPLMMHKSQPKWKYYFSCHFIAVSAWLIMKSNYNSVEKKNRKLALISNLILLRHLFGWSSLRLPSYIKNKLDLKLLTPSSYFYPNNQMHKIL